MSPDVFLGRALMDPATGLPNVPYFRLIRDWEGRRAKRYNLALRVVAMSVTGGDQRARRALSWRLCRELRDSDFLASSGPLEFRILLTSPDAEHVHALCRRLESMVEDLNSHIPEERRLQATFRIEESENGGAPQANGEAADEG